MNSTTTHSRVVQRRISNPMAAQTEFDNIRNGEIPIVLVPSWATFFKFLYTIPSGVFVLYQKWHAKQGLLPPGLIMFWPAWYRVSHIVTRQSRTYNAPVQNCPTSDNVMVHIDVSITFQIQDAEVFVYELGAHRFDEFLSAQTDEAIRGLVHEVEAMQVHDLREEFAMGMKSGLNSKANPFGVTILNVKITNVQLPPDLSKTLQNTTSFKTMMEQQEKKHTADMRILLDDAEQKLTAIRKNNERSVQNLRAAQQRALVSREEQLVTTRTKLEVAQVNEKTTAAVNLTQAKSKKVNAKAEGERRKVEMVEKIRAETEADKIRADQDLENEKIKAASSILAAKSTAQGILADAKTEEMASRQLSELRSFNVKNRRLDVLAKIAESGKMVIGGDTGEKLLGALCPGGPEDLSK